MAFDGKIKNKLKEKISLFLDLPIDVLLNIEKISILGGECIILENFKQLVEFSEKCIKIDTQEGGIDIYGKGFRMNEISREQVKIVGKIEKIEFRQGEDRVSVITTGYVRILLTGKYPERFLSICSNKGMVFWKIERVGYNEFKLSIPVKQVFLLRQYLKKTRCKIKILNRKGLPFIIKKILKRRGFGTGIICFAVLFFILNSFVWGIDIKGNDKVSADIILNKLSNMGVEPGKIRYGIDTKKIADNLIIEIDDLSWVFVKVKGTKMNIVVAERNKKPAILEKTPCDLISSKAGQIYSITVKSGEQKAKIGDTISKGDILVSGTITPKIVGTSARKVHAIADVIARTWYSAMTEVTQSRIDMVRTGKFLQNYNLNLFGKKIKCINSSVPYTKYDTMMQYNSFVPSKIKAQVGMEVISIYEVVENTKEVELKEAFEVATENSLTEVRKNIPREAKLNAAYYHFVHTNSGWVNEVVLECKENIAIENEIKS